MNGLTPNSHYGRQRIYDAYGWWPFNLWADNNGKWYSYMHTEDSVQIETGNTGHGSDLRTIALWTSTDEGANWSYQGVSVSIDDQYAVPGNLQSTWPKNGGAGDHKLIVSPDRQYLYLLYTNFTYDNPAVNSNYVAENMAVARASLDSNGVPGPFYKYYNGSFSQPGVGGHETWVMGPSTAQNIDITIPVKANQKVFFIVDADGDASYDSTYWNPTIDYRPVTQTHHSNTEFNTSNIRWSYYAATSSGYQSMLWNGTDQKWQINGTYCFVNDTLMHPDAGYDSVRAWKAPSSGTISISNIIRKFDVNGGDGVNLKIMKGSTQLWPASGWQPLLYNNATGYNFQVSTTVNTNDMIYFIVNRGQDTSYDSTYWKADIHYAP